MQAQGTQYTHVWYVPRSRMLMTHQPASCCCLFPCNAAAAAQTTTITVYEHCNFAGQAGVAAVGNYPSLAAPVSQLSLEQSNTSLKF
jgi:hypothetical protein